MDICVGQTISEYSFQSMGRKESSEVEYIKLKRAIEIFYRQTMG